MASEMAKEESMAAASGKRQAGNRTPSLESGPAGSRATSSTSGEAKISLRTGQDSKGKQPAVVGVGTMTAGTSASQGAQQPLLLDLPCFNPNNFSQLRASDQSEPSRWPTAAPHVQTNARAVPPKSQGVDSVPQPTLLGSSLLSQ